MKVEDKKLKDKYGYYVDGYVLTCKDGTIIEVELNEGCGGCGNGWSSFEDLKKLEENGNIITNIETKYDKNINNCNNINIITFDKLKKYFKYNLITFSSKKYCIISDFVRK